VPAVSFVTGNQDFSYAAPSILNKISLEIRNSFLMASFKKHLNFLRHYFPFAFPHSHHTIFPHLRFGPNGWLYMHNKCKYCIVL